jgi:hypothetical protein
MGVIVERETCGRPLCLFCPSNPVWLKNKNNHCDNVSKCVLSSNGKNYVPQMSCSSNREGHFFLKKERKKKKPDLSFI